jgi:predicted chitinase
MAMTPEQLKEIMPSMPIERARTMLPAIVETCQRWGITSKLQVAAFLAQTGMESGAYRYLEEIASGDAYEGRTDLGNTQSGDGRRYKGRGWIQLTGRANYRRAGADLGMPLEASPEQVAQPRLAGLVSGWFWRKGSARGDLNELARNAASPIALGPRDTERWNSKRAALAGQGKDVSSFDRQPRGFDLITLGVNGGFNGKPERDVIFDRALRVLPENPLEGGAGGGGGPFVANALGTGGESPSVIGLLVVGGLAYGLWRYFKARRA